MLVKMENPNGGSSTPSTWFGPIYRLTSLGQFYIENDSLSSADIEYNIKGTTDGGDYRGQINIYGSTDGVTWSASPLYSTPIFSDETYHTGTGTFDATGYKYLSAKGYATGGNYLYNCTAKITF